MTEAEISEWADKEWEVYISSLAWDNVKDEFGETVQQIFMMLSLDGFTRKDEEIETGKNLTDCQRVSWMSKKIPLITISPHVRFASDMKG